MTKNALILALVLVNGCIQFANADYYNNDERYRINGNGVQPSFSLTIKDACLNVDHFSDFKRTLEGKSLSFMDGNNIEFNYNAQFKCLQAKVNGFNASVKMINVNAVVNRPDLTYMSVVWGDNQLFITQANLSNINSSQSDTFQEKHFSQTAAGSAYEVSGVLQ